MPPQAPLGVYANDQAIHQIQQLHARQQLVLQEMERQKAVQNMSPPVVNGSMNGITPVETNGLTRVPSEGQQPLATFGDGWANYEATNGHQSDRSDDISPTRSVPHQWGAPAYTNGLPPLETSNVQPQEVKSATIPLLSPVFETRTPSPTASRSADLSKLVNGNNGHKSQSKPNNQQHRRASLAGGSNGNAKESRNGQQQKSTTNNERTNKPSAAGSSPNAWQQQPPRKKGKNKKSRASDQKSISEPLPVNAADRKGG
jgi:hypothetical protein